MSPSNYEPNSREWLAPILMSAFFILVGVVSCAVS